MVSCNDVDERDKLESPFVDILEIHPRGGVSVVVAGDEDES